MSRQSLAVRIGRVYQQISPAFSFADYLAAMPLSLTGRGRIERPVICLLAPPRSGSTLTYQVLASTIDGMYLTNVWNLFSSTALIGGLISKRICRNKTSSFESTQGFVPGLCGEAEGLAFWSQWTGQTLDEATSQWKSGASLRLKHRINLLASDNRPFITGYLGHVFCIDKLRALFPRAIFVHLSRDLIGNGMSLYRASQERWFSTQPKKCNPQAERLDQIADQLITIHESILQQSVSTDTIHVNYAEICRAPRAFIGRLKDFCRTKNVDFEFDLDNIPDQFKERTATNSQSAVVTNLISSLRNRVATVPPEHRDFIESLID